MAQKRSFRKGINWCPERNKLYRFTDSAVTVIRPWPDPRAWHITDEKSCQGVYPRMRLDFLELHSHAPYPYRFEECAWQTIPVAIRDIVLSRSLQDRQWMTLSFLARCPGAAQLLADQPLLGAAAANLTLMRRIANQPAPRKPWRDLRRATRPATGRTVWRRVSRLLRWPSSKSVFRVLGRVRHMAPEQWDPWALGQFPLIWEQPNLRKVLQHGPTVTPGLLEALGAAAHRPELSSLLPTKLFLAAAQNDHDAQNLAGALRGLDNALFNNPNAVLPQRGALHSLEAIEQATEAILPPRRLAGPLPPPPLPGNDRIIPLRSVTALKAEGRQMRHCIGGGGFAHRARAMLGYGYRVLDDTLAQGGRSQATLWIEPSHTHVGRFVVGQLQGPSNTSVSADTWTLVEQWLADAAASYQQHHQHMPPTDPSPIEAAWSPNPQSNAVQWRALLQQRAHSNAQYEPGFVHEPFWDDGIPF